MATPYSQLPYGFRRGEENYAYGEYLRKQRELKRATDFADRIAAEEERISLEQWQPKADETEVKIKTKADGTSTVVSTEKFPAQSLLDDPMGLEGTVTGDWGLGGDVTIPQAEIDEYNRRNDLYAMAGQGDVGEIWPTTTPPLTFSPSQGPLVDIPGVTSRLGTPVTEPVVSPEGTPLAGFDMGGLQRFEPNIIPDEAYRQAYGEQARVMGLLEPDVPPPDLQVMEPQPQMPMVDRAIEQVDRGTANILPPSHLTMGDMPPTLPNWFTGMGEAEAPFAPPQAITPEQGPLGPPGQYSVGPSAITQGEREAELAAALGEGGARYSEALPMESRGLLTDEEILAGAQMPYGDPGVTPMERALTEGVEGPPVVEATPDIFAGVEPEAAPLTSEDIFGGVSPEVPIDPVDPGLRPRGRVETDILESQAEGWVDPDTGLKPAPGKIRTRQEIMGEAFPRGAMRDTSREFNKLVKKVSAETGLTEEDMISQEEFMEGAGALGKVAKTVNKMYEMQKQTAMMALVEGMKKKSKARSLRGVGRRRQGRQMQLLNPTPLQMEG